LFFLCTIFRPERDRSESAASTGGIDFPHEPTNSSRPARGSLQKLREEKKVGTIMGFFESLVKGSSAAEKEEAAPEAVTKKQVTSAGIPMPVDERMAQYLEMKAENSVGVDETGR
jgi:hypothetical protein